MTGVLMRKDTRKTWKVIMSCVCCLSVDIYGDAHAGQDGGVDDLKQEEMSSNHGTCALLSVDIYGDQDVVQDSGFDGENYDEPTEGNREMCVLLSLDIYGADDDIYGDDDSGLFLGEAGNDGC